VKLQPCAHCGSTPTSRLSENGHGVIIYECPTAGCPAANELTCGFTYAEAEKCWNVMQVATKAERGMGEAAREQLDIFDATASERGAR